MHTYYIYITALFTLNILEYKLTVYFVCLYGSLTYSIAITLLELQTM